MSSHTLSIAMEGLCSPFSPVAAACSGFLGSEVDAPAPVLPPVVRARGGAAWPVRDTSIPAWRPPWVLPYIHLPLALSEDDSSRKRTPVEHLDRLYRFLELSRSDNVFEAGTARTRIAGMLNDREVLDALSDFVRDKRLAPAEQKRALELLASAHSVRATKIETTATATAVDRKDSPGSSAGEAGWVIAAVMSLLSLGIIGPAIVLLLRLLYDSIERNPVEPRAAWNRRRD